VAAQDVRTIATLFHTGTRALIVLIVPVAIFGIIRADALLLWWTGQAAVADNGANALRWLLLGTVLNGAMHLPHALQLARGLAAEALSINLRLMLIGLPSALLLGATFGAAGAASSWALVNAVYLAIGSIAVSRSAPEVDVPRWIVADVARPALVSGTLSAATVTAIAGLSGSGFALAASGCVSIVVAAGCAIPVLRAFLVPGRAV
jgi:hypothetical protein